MMGHLLKYYENTAEEGVGHVSNLRPGVIAVVVVGRGKRVARIGIRQLIFISVFGRTRASVFIAVTATGSAYLI